MTTPEQTVCDWLRKRGADVAAFEAFCIAGVWSGHVDDMPIKHLQEGGRALLVVAAMTKPWNAGGFELAESLDYGMAILGRQSATPALPLDRRWVARTFTVDDAGNREIVAECYAAEPFDALAALADLPQVPPPDGR